MAVTIKLRTFSTVNQALIRQIIELNVDYAALVDVPEYVIYDNRTWRRTGDPTTNPNLKLFTIDPAPVDLEREGKILEV